jgi:hypothetical protein
MCESCGYGRRGLLYRGERLTKKGKCPRNHSHKLYEVELIISSKTPFEVNYSCRKLIRHKNKTCTVEV